MSICRHCGEEIPDIDNPNHRRKWCLKPECQEAKRRSDRKRERKREKHYIERELRKAPTKDIPVNKQWPCRKCGKLSTNRFYCPTCREHMLKLAGRVDGDWKYFTTIYHTYIPY